MNANDKNPIPPLSNPITAQPVSLVWSAYFSNLKAYVDKLAASVQSPPKHNDLSEIQGGTDTERYHLTEIQRNTVAQIEPFDDNTDNFLNGSGNLSAPKHNNLASLQGGTDNEYYHLTQAEHSALANIATPSNNPKTFLNGQNVFVVPNHNDLDGIQGGATGDIQHLTTAQANKIANIESLIFGYITLNL